jgi:hypothetical protein
MYSMILCNMFSRSLFFSTIRLSLNHKVRRALLACWSHQTANEWWMTFGSRFPFPPDPNTLAYCSFSDWLMVLVCVNFVLRDPSFRFVPILTPTETKFSFWPPKNNSSKSSIRQSTFAFSLQFPPDASKIAASCRLSQKRNYHPWIKIRKLTLF